MNQVLLSFLCGAAFIGGGTTVVILVGMFVSQMKKSSEKKLFAYWQGSLDRHDKQLAIMERIANRLDTKG